MSCFSASGSGCVSGSSCCEPDGGCGANPFIQGKIRREQKTVVVKFPDAPPILPKKIHPTGGETKREVHQDHRIIVDVKRLANELQETVDCFFCTVDPHDCGEIDEAGIRKLRADLRRHPLVTTPAVDVAVIGSCDEHGLLQELDAEANKPCARLSKECFRKLVAEQKRRFIEAFEKNLASMMERVEVASEVRERAQAFLEVSSKQVGVVEETTMGLLNFVYGSRAPTGIGPEDCRSDTAGGNEPSGHDDPDDKNPITFQDLNRIRMFQHEMSQELCLKQWLDYLQQRFHKLDLEFIAFACEQQANADAGHLAGQAIDAKKVHGKHVEIVKTAFANLGITEEKNVPAAEDGDESDDASTGGAKAKDGPNTIQGLIDDFANAKDLKKHAFGKHVLFVKKDVIEDESQVMQDELVAILKSAKEIARLHFEKERIESAYQAVTCKSHCLTQTYNELIKNINDQMEALTYNAANMYITLKKFCQHEKEDSELCKRATKIYESVQAERHLPSPAALIVNIRILRGWIAEEEHKLKQQTFNLLESKDGKNDEPKPRFDPKLVQHTAGLVNGMGAVSLKSLHNAQRSVNEALDGLKEARNGLDKMQQLMHAMIHRKRKENVAFKKRISKECGCGNQDCKDDPCCNPCRAPHDPR